MQVDYNCAILQLEGKRSLHDIRPTSEYWQLTARQRRYLPVKRALDACLAALGLVLLALPMALIALAVKLSGPEEPVLFRQTRLGRDGAPFRLCKFRSMRHGQTVTAVGRFLRVTSLDELPQLWHVLAGQMSLVGPRPLALYDETVHALRRSWGVYQLRPGLTGLAQISGRDMVADREKAILDRRYLEQLCLRQDARILLATVGKVLRRDGVEKK